MPYDADLDLRASAIVTRWQNISRKKMFGGVCYLMNGNMLGGVYKDYLIVRLGEARQKAALKELHVRPFDITGRPMKGWVMVEPRGSQGESLEKWLGEARDFVATLSEEGP
jgi:hypothetical protein